MQYTVAHFEYHFAAPWGQSLWEQQLADIGFETFDQADAYIQTQLLNHDALQALLAEQSEVKLLSVEDCPDENWNATWEAEHPAEELPLGVRIVPHCAFGAGHHETTSMMVQALLDHRPTGRVLDMGCGTGVLAIMAARVGATDILAVDIDDKSVLNTWENAALNGVTLRTLCQGTVPCEPFDLILANIHRNILLSQMADYAACLSKGGQLWISGFYQADCEPLIAAAASYGLHLITIHHRADWRMIELRKGA